MISSVMNTAFSALDVSADQLARVASRRANPDTALGTVERDHVDATISKVTYQANAAVVRTADEMLGSLLDIVA